MLVWAGRARPEQAAPCVRGTAQKAWPVLGPVVVLTADQVHSSFRQGLAGLPGGILSRWGPWGRRGPCSVGVHEDHSVWLLAWVTQTLETGMSERRLGGPTALTRQPPCRTLRGAWSGPAGFVLEDPELPTGGQTL